MKYYFVAWREEADTSHLKNLSTRLVRGEYKNYVHESREEAEEYLNSIKLGDGDEREDLVVIECESDDEDYGI
jgi:hypothetical protein